MQEQEIHVVLIFSGYNNQKNELVKTRREYREVEKNFREVEIEFNKANLDYQNEEGSLDKTNLAEKS